MSTRVGQQNAIALLQKHLAIACYATAIIANPVEQNYGFAVVTRRHAVPSAQFGTIRSVNCSAPDCAYRRAMRAVSGGRRCTGCRVNSAITIPTASDTTA